MGFFFFFQAEDGIRDLYVTGVQTCALPISSSPRCLPSNAASRPIGPAPVISTRCGGASTRSEERRVGKECRSWWSPHHQKKKKRSYSHFLLFRYWFLLSFLEQELLIFL